MMKEEYIHCKKLSDFSCVMWRKTGSFYSLFLKYSQKPANDGKRLQIYKQFLLQNNSGIPAKRKYSFFKFFFTVWSCFFIIVKQDYCVRNWLKYRKIFSKIFKSVNFCK